MQTDVPVLRSRKSSRNGLPQYWRDRHGKLRLMAIIEGYAMMRRPGCKPFVVASADLLAGRASITVDCGPITEVK